VVPVFYKGNVIAELDIGSDVRDAFSQRDVIFLESVASLVGSRYSVSS
jgi:putative methionine-R-sulfoxide reductase with GAF domain